MPNWCMNTLEYSNRIDEISEFIKDESEAISFNKIVPRPDEFNEDGRWYNWNIENWGTKWDACESSTVSDGVIIFNTAWGPSLEATIALSRKFDDVVFTHSYYEGGCMFAGEYKFLNGDSISSETSDTSIDTISDFYEFLFDKGLESEESYVKVNGEYINLYEFENVEKYLVKDLYFIKKDGCKIEDLIILDEENIVVKVAKYDNNLVTLENGDTLLLK